MAQPDPAAQPTEQQQVPPDFSPDKLVLGGPREHEVVIGPQGGRILVIHRPTQSQMLMIGFSDEEAERIANELKPSRVVMPTNGAGTNGAVAL